MKKSVLLIVLIMLFSAVSCGGTNEHIVVEKDEHSFVSAWRTENPTESITLPLVENGTYDFTVNWGDGSQDKITEWNDNDKKHIYAEAGDYTVIINGEIMGWSFGRAYDEAYDDEEEEIEGIEEIDVSASNITNISQWGSFGFGTTSLQFFNCTHLTITATDSPSLMNTYSFLGLFSRCSALTEIPSKTVWDTSHIATMGSAFEGATLFNGDISDWDMSGVDDTSRMFHGAEKFNQPLSWDVSRVFAMSLMFAGALAFNQDISNWDVSRVFGMRYMFAGGMIEEQMGGEETQADTTTAFDQDLSSWDISDVSVMGGMFSGNTLSTENYDAILIGWSEKAVNRSGDFNFDGGNSQYSSGEAAAARQKLIDNYDWIITDGGMVE